jgi:UDP-glucose 4-epimerase
MKILITGGAGYIGSHTAKHLVLAGHQVVVLDNLSRGHLWACRFGPLEQVDLLDAEGLARVFTQHQPEAVMHFAGLTLVGESVSSPQLYYEHNLLGSYQLLEAMRRHRVEKLIFSSTAATYGLPQQDLIDESHPQLPVNPYGQTKLAVERMIFDYARAYSLQAVILRYFNACGCDPEGELGEVHEPETHLIPCLLLAARQNQPVSIFGQDYATLDGTCVRDYIHVQDLANAHRLALESLPRQVSCEAFNLGIGQGYSVLQVVEAVERVLGRKVERQFLERRAGDPDSLVARSHKAQSQLGWTPIWTNLEATVESAWRWICQYNCQ